MANSAGKTGTLYLLPSPLGEDAHHTIPEYAKETIMSVFIFIVENEKSARRFLRSIGYSHNFDEVKLYSIGKHADPVEYLHYLDDVSNGSDASIISEAGCPGVADPGAEIVKMAHAKKIRVVPLSGPSSILLALMASGLNGQSFAFHGYLPIDRKERIRIIKILEMKSLQEDQSQIFMEAPHRNNKLLDDILSTCHGDTLLNISVNLTLPDEMTKTHNIAIWKKRKPDLHKKPAIFIISRQ